MPFILDLATVPAFPLLEPAKMGLFEKYAGHKNAIRKQKRTNRKKNCAMTGSKHPQWFAFPDPVRFRADCA
jgi:hypothetical protein